MTERSWSRRRSASERDRSGEESDSQQQQIADRNQGGAAEREDHSDLDPNQVQEEGTSNW